MNRRLAGRIAANLAAVILGAAAALLIGEVGVRLAWQDPPAAAGVADSLPIEQVPDRRVLYRMIPGTTGHYNGTEIRLNSLGLRDRDYAVPRPAGVPRLLVLGDSMVFGIGLPPEATLPGRLSELLAPAEVINAGVFGYNITQEISLLADIAPRYRPDVVISCFVHNDIENWGLGDGGAVPEIRSTRFEAPPREAWSTRLADLMLPGTFDPERLNLLPRADAAGLRARLASLSRLYLFAYLRLRTHSWNLSSGEVREGLLGIPSCQADEVIWGPLRESYRRLRRTVEESGSRLMVVIQGGLWWEGAPLERLARILREERIPYLDLTPVWLDRQHYAKEYSLSCDPHPNSVANQVAAELLADFLHRAGLAGGGPTGASAASQGPHDVIEAREDLRERLAMWRDRQRELIAQEERSWDVLSRSFTSSVDFGGADASVRPEQILYGFWEPEPEAHTGRWMSAAGGVTLNRPAGARGVRIELTRPPSPEALRRTPATLRIAIGSPPGRCAVGVVEARVDRLLAEGSPGSAALLELELPAGIEETGPVEIDLSVDQPFPATYLNPARRDPRLVSFQVKRISIE